MGCVQSSCETFVVDSCLGSNFSMQQTAGDDDYGNDVTIDSFKLMPYLGVGGSGLVRAAKKLKGCGANQSA